MNSSHRYRARLRSFTPLYRLGGRDLDALARAADVVVLGAGQPVAEAGSRWRGLVLVGSGAVAIARPAGTAGNGAVVGRGRASHRRAGERVVATVPSTVLVVGERALRALHETAPAAAAALEGAARPLPRDDAYAGRPLDGAVHGRETLGLTARSGFADPRGHGADCSRAATSRARARSASA